MKLTTQISALALAAMLAAPALPVLAQAQQPAEQPAGQMQPNLPTESQLSELGMMTIEAGNVEAWVHPHRIADEESPEEVARLLAILVGSSAYDRLAALGGANIHSTQRVRELASSDGAAASPGNQQQGAAQQPSAGGQAQGANPQGGMSAEAQVNVVNIEERFGGDVAEGLAESTGANAAQINRLRGLVGSNAALSRSLGDAGFNAANLVAIQYNADGSVDLYVIPE